MRSTLRPSRTGASVGKPNIGRHSSLCWWQAFQSTRASATRSEERSRCESRRKADSERHLFGAMWTVCSLDGISRACWFRSE